MSGPCTTRYLYSIATCVACMYTCICCVCDFWVEPDTAISAPALWKLSNVLQERYTGAEFASQPSNSTGDDFDWLSRLQPTLSYVPESCHATRTRIGLQCLLLISSRTSSLASFRASFFVVLLVVWVATAFETTNRRHRRLRTARALASPSAPTKCLCAKTFPVCAIPRLACLKRLRDHNEPTTRVPKPLFAGFNLEFAAVNSASPSGL